VALGGPTNFDYLVLASMADSTRFLAMAGYRSTATVSMATERAELATGAKLTTVAVTSRNNIAHCVDHGVTPYGAGPPVLAAAEPHSSLD
jgi:hypothetical protein